MPAAPTILERPQRWDAAFDADMTEAELDRLLATAPFSEMDPEKFPKRTPLREILRNDTRILKFRKGEIIVRQGDYGTSAFLILQGAARVVLKPDLPAGAARPAGAGQKRIFPHAGPNVERLAPAGNFFALTTPPGRRPRRAPGRKMKSTFSCRICRAC